MLLRWTSPGSPDPRDVAACIGLAALYGALRRLRAGASLSRRLFLILALAGLLAALVRFAVLLSPDHSPRLLERPPLPFSVSRPLPEEVGPRTRPIEVRGAIDSLARDGGEAIRGLGLFGGTGPVGTTMGAIGEVTSTTAEVLIRTVYSGSNVIVEDSTVRPDGPSTARPGGLPVLALAAAAAVALLLLVQLRHLVLVERRRGTLGRFRVLVASILLQTVYVSLGLETLVRNAAYGLAGEGRVLFYVSPFYLLLIVYSIVNGFRVKWIHYLNRWRKYLVLLGAVLLVLLSQSVLTSYYSGRLISGSAALGSLIGCAATAVFFYSIVAAGSIMLHLPSARLVDRKLEQLRILDGLGQSLGATFDEERIVTTAVALGRRIVGADRCWVVRSAEDAFEPWRSSGGPDDVVRHPAAWNAEVLIQLQESGGTLLLNRYPSSDLRDHADPGSPVAGSLLATLLRIRGRTLGILYASTDRQYGFMTEAKGVFATFARQVAAAVENSRLIAKELEQERLQEELAIARRIQEGLLPGELPRPESYDVAGASMPSRQVGGDYYDFFALPGGRYAVVIADVAGKGTAAALLMAALESALHAMAPTLGADAAAIVAGLNRLMTDRTPDDKFVTFFYGVLDPSSGGLDYCCAGHDPPMLVRRDGSTEMLDVGGLVLGVDRDARHATGRITLGPGDRLVLYTDGVTETMGSDGEGPEFGIEGLGRVMTRHPDLGAAELLEALTVELGAFRGEAPAADDMTLLIVGRIPLAAPAGVDSPDGSQGGGRE